MALHRTTARGEGLVRELWRARRLGVAKRSINYATRRHVPRAGGYTQCRKVAPVGEPPLAAREAQESTPD